MDYKFNSQEELFNHIKPALIAKKTELKRLGFQNVDIQDIWIFLIKTKWASANDLMVVDMVNDIMKLDVNDFGHYIKEEKI